MNSYLCKELNITGYKLRNDNLYALCVGQVQILGYVQVERLLWHGSQALFEQEITPNTKKSAHNEPKSPLEFAITQKSKAVEALLGRGAIVPPLEKWHDAGKTTLLHRSMLVRRYTKLDPQSGER
jgi:hypothetical protein